jgi:hypothetical protein
MRIASAHEMPLPSQTDQTTSTGEWLKQSRLAKRGGFLVSKRLFNERALHAMFNEACQTFHTAKEEFQEGPSKENWRGGLPPRRLLSGPGGPIQDQLYCAPALCDYLSEQIGMPMVASGNRASYSYYCREGDYLDLHLDVNSCDISVIVVISENTSPEQAGGELVLYPTFLGKPLSAVRESSGEDEIVLKLVAGDTLILAGGLVPHLVRPVHAGQYRITAPMCFQAVDPAHFSDYSFLHASYQPGVSQQLW